MRNSNTHMTNWESSSFVLSTVPSTAALAGTISSKPLGHGWSPPPSRPSAWGCWLPPSTRWKSDSLKENRGRRNPSIFSRFFFFSTSKHTKLGNQICMNETKKIIKLNAATTEKYEIQKMGIHTNATGQQKQYTIMIRRSKRHQTWNFPATTNDDAIVCCKTLEQLLPISGWKEFLHLVNTELGIYFAILMCSRNDWTR